MKWTEHNIKDLKGKIVIVTGGNSGLGYESCKLYSKHNATVIMASRNKERGEEAIQSIKKELPYSDIELMTLDLGSKKSIESFVEEFNSKYNHLDILLNNAGIMAPPYSQTTDGFESQIGVNHLGHFYLTGLLFPIIKNTRNARIVNISSLMHKFGKIDHESFLYQEGNSYNKMKAYSQSKLANILFTKELSKRAKENNLDTIIVSAHPGISNTNLSRNMPSTKGYSLISQNQSVGALPGIRSSVDPSTQSGDFYGPRGLFGTKGYPTKTKSSKLSNNAELAKELWNFSEELLGFTFNL